MPSGLVELAAPLPPACLKKTIDERVFQNICRICYKPVVFQNYVQKTVLDFTGKYVGQEIGHDTALSTGHECDYINDQQLLNQSSDQTFESVL